MVSKERPRWEHKAIRDRFPLASERQQLPRFDDTYRCGKPPYTLKFDRDGMVLVGGEAGSWNVDEGATVHVITPRYTHYAPGANEADLVNGVFQAELARADVAPTIGER